jgi:hypothetical protein
MPESGGITRPAWLPAPAGHLEELAELPPADAGVPSGTPWGPKTLPAVFGAGQHLCS